ncbi:methyl-accepting chemotaxis protein [Paenibacillus sp. 481]|uniref:methyl-accepting chemotaxis protein n=1 Tax=Paenibacillus sp. 481 TaxID=2835869 RepID=UPI001E3FE5E9|nr:methyl-accepting chemotaxis protein [Paenibacillus sp. 481]UHA75634.1 methyl-accepting chemotaxis protein [Paenibacillus sp. 481]
MKAIQSIIRNMSIAKKFMTLLVVMVVGFVSLGLSSFVHLNKTMDDVEEIYTHHMMSVVWIEKMMVSYKRGTIGLETMIDVPSIERAKKHQANLQKHMNAVNSYYLEFKAASIGEGKDHAESGSDEELAKDLYEKLDQYRQIRVKLEQLSVEGKFTEAQQLYAERGEAAEKAAFEVMVQLEEINLQAAETIYQQMVKDGERGQVVSILTIVIVSVICMVIAGFIMYAIRQPLRRMMALMERAEQGDLTVQSSDESKSDVGQLARNFNAMVVGLRELIAHIQTSSNQILNGTADVVEFTVKSHQSSEQTVGVMNEVSEGSKMQKQATDETGRAMEEMSRGIQDIVQTATSVAEIAGQAGAMTEEGNVAMANVIQEMERITDSVHQTSQRVQLLHEHSDRIGNIVNAIRDIASQTNLLALNASIEAARAGEHGRGFSVVATEVRKLSEQSTESVHHIQQLIQSIQIDTNAVVQSMGEVRQRTDEGKLAVEQAGHTFKGINERVHEVVAQMEEVSASTEEMSACSEQVAASMGEMANIADHSSRQVENVSTVAKEQLVSMDSISQTMDQLYEMATSLQDRVARFHIDKKTDS